MPPGDRERAEKVLDRWHHAVPSDVRWEDVELVAKAFGFEVRKATHGYLLRHPFVGQLNPHGRPFLMISNHANGRQGQVAKTSVEQLVSVICLIRDDESK